MRWAHAPAHPEQLLIEGELIGPLGGAAGRLLAPAEMRLLVRQISTGAGATAFHATLDGRLLASDSRGAGGQSAIQPRAGNSVAAS